MHLLWFLIIGFVAGWLAGKIMGSAHGVIVDIILGLVGAMVGGHILGWFGFAGGTLTYRLIASVFGAVVLIAIVRLIKKI